MKTAHILLGMVMLCGTAVGTPAPIITATPTNGTTTVTIHARTTDGKPTVGVRCNMDQPKKERWAPLGIVTPITPPFSSVSMSGEWTITNVPPGYHEVELLSSNYDDSESVILTPVQAGTNYSIDYVLSRGATFKGRILDDDTGRPIEDVLVNSHDHLARTDAEGRYELPHVAGYLEIVVRTTNYVTQEIYVRAAAEDSTVSIPYIRLKHGGWISGRVERPADLVSNAFAWIDLEIQGNWPTNSVNTDHYIAGPSLAGASDTFHSVPLPAGTYTLDAYWQKNDQVGSPQTWQAKGSVSNINVIAGRDTTNVFIPAKMTILTNSTGGR